MSNKKSPRHVERFKVFRHPLPAVSLRSYIDDGLVRAIIPSINKKNQLFAERFGDARIYWARCAYEK
jgi:hypothetical protein